MMNDERRGLPPDAGAAEQDTALVRDLRALAPLGPRDDQFKREARARQLLYARDNQSALSERNRSMAIASTAISVPQSIRVPRVPWLLRVAIAVAAALGLASGGLSAYLRLQPAEPVSAQSILRRATAAMAPVSPDKAIHETSVYDGLDLGQLTGRQGRASGPVTIDQWTQFTATGAISRQVTTGASTDRIARFRELQTGRDTQLYAVASNTVQTGSIPKGQGASWIDHPVGITDLPAFVRAVQQGAFPDVRLLPRTTLNGVPVDVIENRVVEQLPPGAPAGLKPAQDVYTLYLDAGSYAVRGMDQVWIDSRGKTHVNMRIRVTTRQVIPVAAVPPGTFALRAPASARVIASQFRLVTVAGAIARPGMPAPLLAGDPLGLQLQYISVDKLQGHDRLTYWYKAGTPVYGQYDRRKTVIVELFHYVPPVASPGVGHVRTQQLTLRIAGSTARRAGRAGGCPRAAGSGAGDPRAPGRTDVRGAGGRGPRGAARRRAPDRFLCDSRPGHPVVADGGIVVGDAALLSGVVCTRGHIEQMRRL